MLKSVHDALLRLGLCYTVVCRSGWGAGLGLGDACASERRALYAREVLEYFLGVQVDACSVKSDLDDVYECVGERPGLAVAADAGFAGVEQRPLLPPAVGWTVSPVVSGHFRGFRDSVFSL